MSCARARASRWMRTSSSGSMEYRLCGESKEWFAQRTSACTVLVPSASSVPSRTPQHSWGKVSSPCWRRSIHSGWAILKAMVLTVAALRCPHSGRAERSVAAGSLILGQCATVDHGTRPSTPVRLVRVGAPWAGGRTSAATTTVGKPARAPAATIRPKSAARRSAGAARVAAATTGTRVAMHIAVLRGGAINPALPPAHRWQAVRCHVVGRALVLGAPRKVVRKMSLPFQRQMKSVAHPGQEVPSQG
jgi:hypothetical protein